MFVVDDDVSVLLLDLALPDLTGLDVQKRITAARVACRSYASGEGHWVRRTRTEPAGVVRA